MKQRRIISFLSAALLGLSAAAFPPAAPEPFSIVAEAATSGNWEYTVENGKATITGYNGTSTSVTIPSTINGKTVTKIGNYAFLPTVNGVMTPKNITSVTIPSTVTEIGKCAFAGTPLKSLTLSGGIQRIKNAAFKNTALTSVTIPSSIRVIEPKAFNSCSSLTNLRIAGTPSIGENAFSDCSSMTVLRIEGAAVIDTYAFSNCSSLLRVWLHKDCVPKSRANGLYKENIFKNCTSLEYINGSGAWYRESGTGKPVLTSNTYARKLIQRFFASSESVKFVDTYCTALCNYIVSTETKSWMGDAVKARQLNDWIVRHCEYEDFKENGHQYNEPNNEKEYSELIGMNDNQFYSSVFLSYGLNLRGEGVGESVCAGFAKAYTMLLRAAGIESYVIRNTVSTGPVGHMWNIVKIKGKYYQCDTCASDASDFGLDFATNYQHFLVSASRMNELQGYTAVTRSLWNPAESREARMFPGYNVQKGQSAMNRCNYEYSNLELFQAYGLKEDDWNFDGNQNTSTDTEMLNLLQSHLPNVDYEYMAHHFHNLLQIGWSPKQWYDYYC